MTKEEIEKEYSLKIISYLLLTIAIIIFIGTCIYLSNYKPIEIEIETDCYDKHNNKIKGVVCEEYEDKYSEEHKIIFWGSLPVIFILLGLSYFIHPRRGYEI